MEPQLWSHPDENHRLTCPFSVLTCTNHPITAITTGYSILTQKSTVGTKNCGILRLSTPHVPRVPLFLSRMRDDPIWSPSKRVMHLGDQVTSSTWDDLTKSLRRPGMTWDGPWMCFSIKKPLGFTSTEETMCETALNSDGN